MRLIDADALKKRVKEFRDDAPQSSIRRYVCNAILSMLGDENQTPTIEAGPKWISVEERLPELIPCNAGTAYSEAVIVWTNGRKAMVAVWDGIDFLCAADYWEAWGEKITHWMPLPEPPKEG